MAHLQVGAVATCKTSSRSVEREKGSEGLLGTCFAVFPVRSMVSNGARLRARRRNKCRPAYQQWKERNVAREKRKKACVEGMVSQERCRYAGGGQ